MARTHGENVSIEYNGNPGTTATLVTLKDANMATRVLAATERLTIDSLECNAVTGAGTVDIFADINANGAVDANELIASFTTTATLDISDKEGISIPLGITPSVIAATSGAVKLTGSGRIFATATITRPAWQARLNS